jgi:hypothetical protein
VSKVCITIQRISTTAQWIRTTGTPLFTTGTQLVTTQTPLVCLTLHWLPLGSTCYHWEAQLLTSGNIGIPLVLLEYPCKHHWGNLLNVDEVDVTLVTTGIPLETSLGWGEGTNLIASYCY